MDPQAEASESSPSASDDADIWQQVAANQATPMAPSGAATRAAGDWLGSRERYRLVEEPVAFD
ncbi:MAG: hypothetical protein AAFX51_02120 [Cyanobacteria bacterium J06636_28]